jgi:triphosphatase
MRGMSVAINFHKPDFPALMQLELDPRWPLAVAAQWTVLRYLADMLAQRERAWEGTEPEGVHQIRVAARRVRTALQTFRGIWPEADMAAFLTLFSELADVFTSARDLDVMIEYFEAQLAGAPKSGRAALSSLLEKARREREAEQPRIREQLEMLEASELAGKLLSYFSTRPCSLFEFASAGRLVYIEEPPAQSSRSSRKSRRGAHG